MVLFQCDGCGAQMDEHSLRYTVNIDVRAAYNEIEVTLLDLVRNHRKEIIALLEKLEERDPVEVEEQIYKQIHLDLCPSCQKAYIKDPLHFQPQSTGENNSLDIDNFLRSLGFGTTPPEA